MSRSLFLKFFLCTLFVVCTLAATPLLACKTVFKEPRPKLFSQKSDSLGELKSYLAALTDGGLLSFQELSNYFESDMPLPSTNSSLIIHESALHDWKTKQPRETLRNLLNWIQRKIDDDSDDAKKKILSDSATENSLRAIKWVRIKDSSNRIVDIMDTRLTRAQYFDLIGQGSPLLQRRLNLERRQRLCFQQRVDGDIPINGMSMKEIMTVANALSKQLGVEPFYPKELVDEPTNPKIFDVVASRDSFGCPGVRMIDHRTWDRLIKILWKELKKNQNNNTPPFETAAYIDFDEGLDFDSYPAENRYPFPLGSQELYDMGRVIPEIYFPGIDDKQQFGFFYTTLLSEYISKSYSDRLKELSSRNDKIYWSHIFWPKNYYHIRFARTVRR